MTTEEKRKKLHEVVSVIFGVSKLPSISELNTYLGSATEKEIDRLFLALWTVGLISSFIVSTEPPDRGERIEEIRAVFFETSEPEGSA